MAVLLELVKFKLALLVGLRLCEFAIRTLRIEATDFFNQTYIVGANKM